MYFFGISLEYCNRCGCALKAKTACMECSCPLYYWLAFIEEPKTEDNV
jgi:hypothetical protein